MRVEDIKDGKIEVNSPVGKLLGFTSDKFTEVSWLWKKGKTIYISFIETKQKGKGHFKQLVKRLLDLGFTVKIPCPLGLMRIIVVKWGFRKTTEYDPRLGEVEVWVKGLAPSDTSSSHDRGPHSQPYPTKGNPHTLTCPSDS